MVFFLQLEAVANNMHQHISLGVNTEHNINNIKKESRVNI